jgi:hypothetical protein
MRLVMRQLLSVRTKLGLLQRIGLWSRRFACVSRAIQTRADLMPFREKPSFRLLIGLFLIGLSMLLGWPAVGALSALAVILREPLVAVIGAPATYGLSWLVWGIGIWIAGRNALSYVTVFNRWLIRIVVEWLIGPTSPGESHDHRA